MTPSSPTSSRRPLPLRWAVGLLRALASLQLAVVLIGSSVVVLALATFIENSYGTPAVQFGIYGAGWFAAIMALLATNVLCAAVVRFPWKRRHIGFVITHAGILTLLAGCLLTWLGGIDARLSVLEGRANHRAQKTSQHFQLKVFLPSDPADTEGMHEGASAAGAGDRLGRSEPERVITVPFVSGPFNWHDYRNLSWFPWRLASRSQGVIYDQDGIKLELLDYYSDSRRDPVPQIALEVRSPSAGDPRAPRAEEPSTPMKLAVSADGQAHIGRRGLGMGERQTTPQGQRVVFWMSGSPAETAAFLDSRPEGPLGQLGQVVLRAADKKFHFLVEDLQKQGRQELGASGFEVELASFEPKFLAVQLRVHRAKQERPQRLALFADMPEFNQQGDADGIFGTYWLDASAKLGDGGAMGEKMLRNAAQPRIDIIQGHDRRLYYRAWKSPQLEAAGPWPTLPGSGDAIGAAVVAFEKSSPVSLYLENFVSSAPPDWQIKPLPFRKKSDSRNRPQPRARVRLSVAGAKEDFWLASSSTGLALPDEQHLLRTGNRAAAITMSADEIELGFQVYLHKFQRKLDPGTGMDSYYASLVDFLEPQDDDSKPKEQAQRLYEKALITLNEPIDFSDPTTGRSYRLYQSSFGGPWKSGEAEFDQQVKAGDPRDQLFLSVFTVNYDPGRGLKYAGSLLIVAGIAAIYYVRAQVRAQAGAWARG